MRASARWAPHRSMARKRSRSVRTCTQRHGQHIGTLGRAHAESMSREAHVFKGGDHGWCSRVVFTGGGHGWWSRVVFTGGGPGWCSRAVVTGGTRVIGRGEPHVTASQGERTPDAPPLR